MTKHTSRRSVSPRAQNHAEFDPGQLHDDALVGSAKAAKFLGLPESTFFLVRKRMGRDFPRPVLVVGRPRYRVGSLREWLHRLESVDSGSEQ